MERYRSLSGQTPDTAKIYIWASRFIVPWCPVFLLRYIAKIARCRAAGFCVDRCAVLLCTDSYRTGRCCVKHSGIAKYRAALCCKVLCFEM